MYNVEDDNYLAHYGVKGMKWGVRNEDTLRKYAGGNGRRFIGNRVKNRIRNSRNDREFAKQYTGSTWRGYRKFKRVRNRTLKSNDPVIVAKGMHTLTDSELSSKINRLEKEKRIREIAESSKQHKYDTTRKKQEARKAKKERRASGLGSRLITSTYNSTVNRAGQQLVDQTIKGLSVNKTVSDWIGKRRRSKVAAKAGAKVASDFLGRDNPIGFS